jgi:hypothetical protein
VVETKTDESSPGTGGWPPHTASPVRWRDAAEACCGYVVVTLAFCAQSGRGLLDSFVGNGGDRLPVLWNAWWMKTSIFEGRNPFFSDRLFHPYGASLVLHNFDPLQASFLALLASFLPLAVAYNVTMLLGLPLAGIGAYALCRHVTKDHASSFVGGLVFMLSPNIVSKAHSGWTNMLYGGFLALYLTCLLKATEPAPRFPSRTSRGLLAATILLLLFSGTTTTVFAVNVSVFAFAWSGWTSGRWRETAARFSRALLPGVLLATPYLAMAAFHIIKYRLSVMGVRRLSYVPEPIAYILPFSPTSVYAGWVRDLGFSELTREQLPSADMACYLGLLVLPLSVAGFVACRRMPVVRFCAVLFVSFLVLSAGPVLLHQREVVSIGGVAVRLPFDVWQRIPILGLVVLSGRYLVGSYVAMSFGVACLVWTIRSHFGRAAGAVLTVVCALAVCVDFAFRFVTTPLPPVPRLSGIGGAVLDPRIKSGLPMYYQTQHQRLLVGGYLARTPQHTVQEYRAAYPEVYRMLSGKTPEYGRRDALLADFRTLGITDVMLGPNDPRGTALEEEGFGRWYEDSYSVVWVLPRN